MPETLDRHLKPVRLQHSDAYLRGRVLHVVDGQPLSLFEDGCIRAGWLLVIVDSAGTPLRAYRWDKDGEE